MVANQVLRASRSTRCQQSIQATQTPAMRAAAETMLRDIAYVLHLTRTVKESLYEEKMTPGLSGAISRI
jgi:hypothetical protein